MAKTVTKKSKALESEKEISEISEVCEDNKKETSKTATSPFAENELRELYTKLETGVSPITAISLVKSILHLDISNEEQSRILNEYRNSIEKWLQLKQIIPVNTSCIFKALFLGKSPVEALVTYIIKHDVDKDKVKKLMSEFSKDGLYGAVKFISEDRK